MQSAEVRQNEHRRSPNATQIVFDRNDQLVLAGVAVSFLLSIYLWFQVDQQAGLFVGLWVPSILGIANYFKLSARRTNDG